MAVELTSENVEAAKVVLNHPVVMAIFDELEKTAITQAIHAPLDNDRIRADLMAEVRTIRALRSKLQSLKMRGASLTDEGASD